MKPNLQRTFIPTVKPSSLSNPSNLRPTLSISSPQWLKNKLRRRNFPSSKKTSCLLFLKIVFQKNQKPPPKTFLKIPKKKKNQKSSFFETVVELFINSQLNPFDPY